jgi:hypothetical protein
MLLPLGNDCIVLNRLACFEVTRRCLTIEYIIDFDGRLKVILSIIHDRKNC